MPEIQQNIQFMEGEGTSPLEMKPIKYIKPLSQHKHAD